MLRKLRQTQGAETDNLRTRGKANEVQLLTLSCSRSDYCSLWFRGIKQNTRQPKFTLNSSEVLQRSASKADERTLKLYFLLPPSSRGVIYWSNSTSMPFKLPWDRGILGPSFWFFKRDSGFLSQVINFIRRAKVSEMRKNSAPSWFQGKPLHKMQWDVRRFKGKLRYVSTFIKVNPVPGVKFSF